MELGIFHKGDFPSDNKPRVAIYLVATSQRLGMASPSEAPQATMGGQVLRLRFARGPGAEARVG